MGLIKITDYVRRNLQKTKSPFSPRAEEKTRILRPCPG